MQNKYETRNKIIKWFTILVVVAFLATVVGSGIVAFISTSSEKKQNVVNTLNKPTEKEIQEINNYQSSTTWQLIQQNK